MERLGGITPKTLTQRLRELEDDGILSVDRQPGRREVWYRLTPAGADLGPVIDQLNWWGLRHAWRWPRDGEPLHAEHLLRSAVQAIDLGAGEHRPARWLFRADGAEYLAVSDGERWSLALAAPDTPADVTIRGTARALAALIFSGSDGDVEITGEEAPVKRFRQLIGSMSAVVRPPGG
jgi:DNA-binding transcriptional ArsR family regulator